MSYRKHKYNKDMIGTTDTKRKKVYVSYGYKGYASWLRPLGFDLTARRENADLILLAGGEDIDSNLYGAKDRNFYGKVSIFRGSFRRDEEEQSDYEYAVANGIPIWGTCRGIQMLCALNGGSLIQDINHSGSHSIKTYDGKVISVNSLHHQMCNPFPLDSSKFKILGWCDKGKSDCYTMYGDPDFTVPDNFVESEVLYFPETQSMGAQYHPEMMEGYKYYVESNKWLNELFLKFFNGTLDKELESYKDVFVKNQIEIKDEEIATAKPKSIIVPFQTKLVLPAKIY